MSNHHTVMKMEVSKLGNSQSNDLLKYYNLSEEFEVGSEKQNLPINVCDDKVESPAHEVTAKVAPKMNSHAPVDASENNNYAEGGVEDGPVKNVREIRAMFNKNYDYESYAKPRSFNKSPTSPNPKTENHFTYTLPETNDQTPVVQQQVRGLFKEVFEVEKMQPPVPPPRTVPPKPKEINNNEPPEPQLTVAQKVACFNTAKPPVVSIVEVDPNKSPVIDNTPPLPPPKPQVPLPPMTEENNNIIIAKNHQNEVQHKLAPRPKMELTITQAAEEVNDIKEVLAKVQKETLNLETFDESLDEFYNVLEELSI